MSFFLHRTKRGRPTRIVSSYIGSNDSLVSVIPGTAGELGGLCGVGPADWFSSFMEKSNGVGNFSLAPTTGMIEHNTSNKRALSAGQKNIGFASSHYTSGSFVSATFDKSLKSGESFVYVAYLAVVGEKDDRSYHSMLASGGPNLTQIMPWRNNSYTLCYCYDAVVQTFASGNIFSRSGALYVVISGWDKRITKAVSVYSGTRQTCSGVVVDDAWATAGNFRILGGDSGGNSQLCAFGGWGGAVAETIMDNIVAVDANLRAGLGYDTRNHSVSSSIVCIPGRSITRANELARSENGLLIHPSVTNLLTESYSPSVFTESGLTKLGWQGVAGTGIRTLVRYTETATSEEHKASATFTPLATGNHVIYFEVKFGSGCEQIAARIDNGTDAIEMSLDSAGQQTPFAVAPDVTITTIASSHYSVSWIVDLTVTDVASLVIKGLEASTYNDDYLGSTSKSFHAGNWCVSYGAAPSVHPVSLGSTATAIAPIVDWTLASALKRLSTGRMSCDFTAHFGAWPEADVPLWSWRKDASNGVEVWLVYKSTTDNRRLFVPAIKAIVSGSSVTTELSYGVEWVLQNDASGELVETLRASISIDSTGVATWWFRADAGIAIYGYELAPNLSGVDQVASYTAPVPTSIRLGSSLGGTGQQAMTIKEVAVW